MEKDLLQSDVGTIYIAVTCVCIFPVIVLAYSYIYNLYNEKGEPQACRKLGLQNVSNLADEHDQRYSGFGQESEDAPWKVKSLWVYPVKSCTGIELEKGTVTGMGMEYDRYFCFAQLNSKFPAGLDESKKEKAKHAWKFITQRTFPAMARIKTELWLPDPTSSAYSPAHANVQSKGVLVLKFPSSTQGTGPLQKVWKILRYGGGAQDRTIHIPFDPSPEQVLVNGYTSENMEIWKDNPTSLMIASTERSVSWIDDLRYYLGITNHLALFRLSTQPREVYRCAPSKNKLGYQPTVGFQDAYPLHILNVASVHDVARNMERDAPRLGARNFRPNIVITGGQAYAEDSWKRIIVGKFEYYCACRTVRCLLPNVNPATGVRHRSEPNRTLKSFRRIDQGDPLNACLGMQMVAASEHSQIKVGDEVTVLETGEHVYIKQ